MVLIAGLPGTGKSYLSEKIREHLGTFVEISIDPLKEHIWNEQGFNSREEKRATEAAALGEFFRLLESAMERGERVIADYPFSEKQRPELERLCLTCGYRPVTVRMTADLEILYERQRRRDLDESRHLGHIVERFHAGDVCADRSRAAGLLSREEFHHRCTSRGYETFALGPVMELDTSNFSAVDVNAVIDWIDAQCKNGGGQNPTVSHGEVDNCGGGRAP